MLQCVLIIIAFFLNYYVKSIFNAKLLKNY